jgi:hypothetical protein
VPQSASIRWPENIAYGAATLPHGLPKAAAAKVAASLVAHKLVWEVLSKGDMPSWGKDEHGRPLSLVILRAGKDAVREVQRDVNLDETADPGDLGLSLEVASTALPDAALPIADDQAEESSSPEPVGPVVAGADCPALEPVHLPQSAGWTPRPGSKQGQVIQMLSGPVGASLTALNEATGWLPHTTRAAWTGLRKRG